MSRVGGGTIILFTDFNTNLLALAFIAQVTGTASIRFRFLPPLTWVCIIAFCFMEEIRWLPVVFDEIMQLSNTQPFFLRVCFADATWHCGHVGTHVWVHWYSTPLYSLVPRPHPHTKGGVEAQDDHSPCISNGDTPLNMFCLERCPYFKVQL